MIADIKRKPVDLVPSPFRIAIKFMLILCCSIGMSGCNANSPKLSEQALIEYSDGEIKFDGPIDAAAANRFRAVSSAAPRGSTLRIRSGGGSAAASFDIAEIVHEKKLNVTVFDYCMSGCAYIFIAGDKKNIENNSLLGFHNTVSSGYELIYNSKMFRGQKVKNNTDIREHKIFRNTGVSFDILNKADDILEALCVGDRSKPTWLGDGKHVAFGWNYHAWVLSLDQMEKMGVRNISGYWPTSKNEVDAVARRYFKPGFLVKFVTDIDSIPDRQPSLPPCY
jgi:ATP-dependent protease ClpP protease subunit